MKTLQKMPKSVITILLLVSFLTGTASMQGCAGKDRPTVVATVATHGTTLITALKATQQAIIDAEAKQLIPRNAAVTSIQTFQKIGASGEEVAKLLNTLLALPADSTEVPTTIDRIQAALDIIQSQLFDALVPIENAEVRSQVSRLASEVSKTIALINREILGDAR